MGDCQVTVWGQDLVGHLILHVFCGHRHLLSVWVAEASLNLLPLFELIPARCTSSLLPLIDHCPDHQQVNLFLSCLCRQLHRGFLAGSLLRGPLLLFLLCLFKGTLEKASTTSVRVDAVSSKDTPSEVDACVHYGHPITLEELIQPIWVLGIG